MKAAIAAIIIAVAATACASKPVKQEAVVVVQPAKRQPPATAMEACPALGELDDDTFGAVVRKLGDAAHLYKLCEQRRQELADFIRRELPPHEPMK